MSSWISFDAFVWVAYEEARDAKSTEPLQLRGKPLKVAGCTFQWAPGELIITHTLRGKVTAVAKHAVPGHAFLRAVVLARQLWAEVRGLVQVGEYYVNPTTAFGQECMRKQAVPYYSDYVGRATTWAAAGPFQPSVRTEVGFPPPLPLSTWPWSSR